LKAIGSSFERQLQQAGDSRQLAATLPKLADSLLLRN
jgi:hypothetical protein